MGARSTTYCTLADPVPLLLPTPAVFNLSSSPPSPAIYLRSDHFTTPLRPTRSQPPRIMSQVKFEKETVRATTGAADKEDFMHNIGEALTKSSGPNGYLAVSLHPMRLKRVSVASSPAHRKLTRAMRSNSGT
jgi:hypothetical protein